MIYQFEDPFDQNESSQVIDMTKNSLENRLKSSIDMPNIDSSICNDWEHFLLKSELASGMLNEAEEPLNLAKTPSPIDFAQKRSGWNHASVEHGNDFFRPWEKAKLKSMNATETHKKPRILFDCNICDRKFTKKQHFRQHIEMHRDPNQFICDVCGKKYASTRYLDIHKKVHINTKLFTCPKCNKSFATKMVLTRHLLIHTGVKPFSCDSCGKCFMRKDHLDIHERFHKGVKPFHCELCGLGFTSKQHLVHSHMMIHRRKAALMAAK